MKKVSQVNQFTRETLRTMDRLRFSDDGYSYRELGRLYEVHHTTIRKYYLRYLKSLNWFQKLMRVLRGRKNG